jgi:hypothetical protein
MPRTGAHKTRCIEIAADVVHAKMAQHGPDLEGRVPSRRSQVSHERADPEMAHLGSRQSDLCDPQETSRAHLRHQPGITAKKSIADRSHFEGPRDLSTAILKV